MAPLKKKPLPPMMRMKQLTEVTGVTKATVSHYIKTGLVPKPLKTHRNMGYYDETHVNVIRLIKELQAKRYLPLSVIKQLIKGGRSALTAEELHAAVKFDGKLFPGLRELPEVQAVTIRVLSSRSGVSLKDIRIMERHGMIRPVKKGSSLVYTKDDIRIVEAFGQLQKIGLAYDMHGSAKVLSVYFDLFKIIVEEEAKGFTSRAAGKVPPEEIPAMVEEVTDIVNTIIGLFHKKLIVETVRRYRVELKKEQRAAGMETQLIKNK